MSLIQGEKIISTAIGQTWDMTPGSSTCRINNTPLILSSYPIKPFCCSWVLWAVLTQEKEGSLDKRRSSERMFTARRAFWKFPYWLAVCQEETPEAFSQPWSWCWMLGPEYLGAFCQHTLQFLCLEERVLLGCFCCSFAVRDLVWLHCFLGSQVMRIALLQVTCRQGNWAFWRTPSLLFSCPQFPMADESWTP